MSITPLLNRFCKALYKKEYKKFASPCSVKAVQEGYLLSLLNKNSDTVYGKKYGFDKINSYRDFAKAVPVVTYEELESYISRISDGEKSVLTKEDVILLELTSGSSGGKKLIPYTKALKSEFQRGIKPWLYDIYNNVNGALDGKSYWSITPVTSGKTYTKCGIPIGFEEDTEYFGRLTGKLMKGIFAVSGEVKLIGDTDRFYFDTVRQLIACDKLTLISVWNPTFLSLICDYISEHKQKLQNAIPQKAEMIERAVAADNFTLLFPDIKIISCWADGSAAYQTADIKRRFPSVFIQPKGLLATECFVSFPLCGCKDSRLSIYSHFFEFKSLADGKIYPAWEIKSGEYEVIVTTGGGFYRYSSGDIVRVTEVFADRPPTIKFLRRSGITSDMFGEKLTEDFVRNTLLSVSVAEEFLLLAPDTDRYILYTTDIKITSDILDAALCDSYHYKYCRDLGQLKKARVEYICGNPKAAYIKRMQENGMRLGDIKPAYLSVQKNWENYFERKSLC